MKSQLASLEVHYLIKELKILVNGRIDKIFQIGKKEFYIQFHVSNMGKKLLRITDRLIYFTDKKPAMEEPPGFCMFLRKNLNNSRLREINQKEPERIIEFLFESKKGARKLVVELFGGGNLLILDENNIILSAAHYEKYRERHILAKTKYAHPKMQYNLFDMKLKDLKDLFKKSKKENIVKCLAVDLGLGGIYSEEICLLSNIHKNKEPQKFSAKETDTILKSIENIVNKKINPVIYYKNKEAIDVFPFELEFYKNLEGKKFKVFNEALDYYFSKEVKAEKKPTKYDKDMEKIKRIIEEQKSTIENLKKSEKKNREKGELIYNNYKLIEGILAEINKATKKYSWKDIKEKLKGHKIIKEFDLKEKKITIDIN